MSPPLSVRSDDIDIRRTTTTVNSKTSQSFCKDPNCAECLKISRFMFKSNLNKLCQQFPRVQLHEIEMALQRSGGTFSEAIRFLRNRELSTAPRSLFKGYMPPSSPPTCNCQDCKDAILMTIESSSRKRPLIESPIRQFSPVQYTPLSKRRRENLDEVLNISRRPSPPSLIKYCTQCESSLPLEDRFCGKCGSDQTSFKKEVN